jgi:hypothetical protein
VEEHQPDIVRATSDINVANFAIGEEMLRTSVLHPNIGQELLLITADRTELCLIAYDKAQEGRHEWKGALGAFLTALTALVAADFKSFLGLNGDIWKLGFLVVTVLTAIWTIRSLYKTTINRELCKTKYLMNELKRNSIRSALTTGQ